MNIGINFDSICSCSGAIDKAFFKGHDKMRFNSNSSLTKMIFSFIGTKNNVAKVIRILKKDNNKIFIIVNTDDKILSQNMEAYRILIELFLIEKNIPYDELILSSTSLENNHNNIDFMIESSMDFSKTNNSKQPTICLANNYNNVDDSNISFAKDWLDIYIKLFEKCEMKGKRLINEKN